MKKLLLLGLLALTGCTTMQKPTIKETRQPDGTIIREISAEYLRGPGLNTFKPFPPP